MTYELHPLCTLFPRVVGADFDSLVADIRANGLRQAIVLYGDMILDGGNRYRACLEAGVNPHFEHYEGDSIVSFVLSANLHRRHLSAGQQAAIVASAQDWAKAQGRGGDGSNQHKSKPATLPVSTKSLDTVADRATQSGASERTQRMADKVAKASPDLARQVAHGEISLPKAIEQISPKPAPHVEPMPEPEYEGPSAEEIRAAELQEQADQEAFNKLLLADDKLASAYEEIKRLNAINSVLESRLQGLQNEKNEAIRLCKSLQRRLDRAEKAAA